ncbi:unnamed protein product [Ambrosiozyma monospora]|uniref:Unnamed protein product n=1 Tax=Ambrosiozyma monospora TaxID=43982 RepID=A0A9W6Z8Z7_AMBMO|nr:unnamed protein product [Ambrosiozyma monospora]
MSSAPPTTKTPTPFSNHNHSINPHQAQAPVTVSITQHYNQPQSQQHPPTDLNQVLSSRKRGQQYTRKDLGLDIDDENSQLTLNSMDFLKVQPNNRLQQLDNLSNSGSSQASSTVINPDFKDESQKITSTLKSMDLQTIDINDILNKKNKEQQLVQINQKELMQQKQLQLQQQQKQQQQAQQAQAQAQLQLQQAQQQEQSQLQQAQQEQYPNYEDAEVEPEIEVDPEEDEDDDDYFDDDKLNDYINGMLPSPPSSPPRELDPNKLYALYDFSGPDPSHLELQKDASVVLLNDSDAYWWLVKRLQDGVVGFAPAEILETYRERLARLNCWKNEVIERNQNGEDVGTYLSQDDLKIFELNSQRKYHNSVVPVPTAAGAAGAGAGRQLGLSGTHGRSSSLNSFDNSGISSGSGSEIQECH